MRNEKITPLYERLSRDDELQGESMTGVASIDDNIHYYDHSFPLRSKAPKWMKQAPLTQQVAIC